MIVIFGGTFDPVHAGHLNMANHTCRELTLDTLYFMPCAQPAHKTTPGVTTLDRLAMLELAIKGDSRYRIDDRELKREGPSYSVLSLRELRAEHPDQPIAFLIGMDSFNNLHRWYAWQEIVELCHILVYRRPGEVFTVPVELSDYVTEAKVSSPRALHSRPGGLLYLLNGPELAVSSTALRTSLRQHNNDAHLLHPAVFEYIEKHRLYRQ